MFRWLIKRSKQINESVDHIVDLWVAGVDGYHSYRIPSILSLGGQKLIAMCEGRRNSSSDEGVIDLICKTSEDAGRTWSDHNVIFEDGENTIGNPCPVYIEEKNEIILPFCVNNYKVFTTKSSDFGKTWSNPVEITNHVKKENWGWYATGPGHGLVLKSGRIIIPCDFSATSRKPKEVRSNTIFSDDGGKSWQIGHTFSKGNECMLTELSDGNVYINMRRSREQKERKRISAISSDGGETFAQETFVDDLKSPICQGSIVCYDGPVHLFANPNGRGRSKMTIHVSRDDCNSWGEPFLVYGGPSAYSDIAVDAQMDIHLVFERGEVYAYKKITYVKLNLDI